MMSSLVLYYFPTKIAKSRVCYIVGEGRGGETMWLDKKGNFLCLLHYYRETLKHEICVCLRKLHEIKISDKHTLATLQCVVICT